MHDLARRTRLGVSHSIASGRLSPLEQVPGVRQLARNARGAALTEVARLFRDYAGEDPQRLMRPDERSTPAASFAGDFKFLRP